MNNSFLNPHHTVNLTGLIDITAIVLKLIAIDENDDEQITKILDLFVQFNNISTVIDVQVPIGGGLTYTLKQWVSPISDQPVPGLASLIGYLQQNYHRIDDDSIINNYYNISKLINNITTQENVNYHKHQNISQKYYTKHIHTNDTYTYNKYITHTNITNESVPNYIHTENSYTYIKHDNTTLLNQIHKIQNQIENLQTKINNLP